MSALAVALVSTIAVGKQKPVAKVIFVNFGRMNPTFNASIHPVIIFTSLPGIESEAQIGGIGKAMLSAGTATLTLKGEPKLVVDCSGGRPSVLTPALP